MTLSLIDSEATKGFDPDYFRALAFDHELGGKRGIDAVLKAHKLDALVLPVVGFSTTPGGLLLSYSSNGWLNQC